MIKITSDSTCDLSEDLLRRYRIEISPLTIIKGEKEFLDGRDISPQDIFTHVAAGGELCKTSAVNVADYLDFFAPLAEKYEAVVHLNLGAKFSSCHQNALLAAEDFPNVYVVDSQNLSTGHGHLVLQAAEMAEQGLPAEEIVERLEELAPLVEASFVIDTMEYLQKGGRCSSLAAFAATALKMKPSIKVEEGAMTVGKKYRGGLEKCLRQYIHDRLAGREDIDLRRIFVTHAFCPPEMVEMAVEEVRKYQPFQEVLVTTAGCTVSCHCGPNTLGILFLRKA